MTCTCPSGDGSLRHPCPEHDPYVEANRALLLSRSQTGQAKYGTDLTRGDLTPEQWVQHAIEELLDAANYLQRIKANMGPQSYNTRDAGPAAFGGRKTRRE